MNNLFLILTFALASNFIQNINGLDENDICTGTKGEKGICKKNEDCTSLRNILRNGERPNICGWPARGRYPIICCPLDEVKPGTRIIPPGNRGGSAKETERNKHVKIVRQKCAEYGKFVKEEIPDPALGRPGKNLVLDYCGRLAEPMIVGGVEAKPKEFPHMALIGYRDPPSIIYECAGSLISERFVISAAHCSKTWRRGRAKWVLLGELDTSTDSEDASPELHKIVQIINYSQSPGHDITLFKLAEEVIFNPYIRPICLDTNLEIPSGFLLTASGWGHTEWAGVRSDKLMKVVLEYVPNDICSYNYTRIPSFSEPSPRGVITESKVCAGKEIGKDTCQGDSGGPLQANLTEPYCMYDLVGITSYGKACGEGYPAIYTRVSHYISWIVQHVWPDNK